MFTGIIETLGEVQDVRQDGTNVHLDVRSSFTHELRVDQSVAHDGVCLTVVALNDDVYTVTAIDETLRVTSLGEVRAGHQFNLERCAKVGDRLDGHVVQGHVDVTGTLVAVEPQDGSWVLHFDHPQGEGWFTVPKGSITVNGISLTVVDSALDGFSVAIIPYTWEHTNLSRLEVGDPVNLEFDVMGKYVARLVDVQLKARGVA